MHNHCSLTRQISLSCKLYIFKFVVSILMCYSFDWLFDCLFSRERTLQSCSVSLPLRAAQKVVERIRRKTRVIPTPDAFFFGSECNYDSINSQRRCGVCTAHAGRVHAIFVRGGVPDFRKFCKCFARFLRKICVISTLDSRVILHSNARRLGKELQRSSAVRATTLAEFTQLLCARRAEIFRKL